MVLRKISFLRMKSPLQPKKHFKTTLIILHFKTSIPLLNIIIKAIRRASHYYYNLIDYFDYNIVFNCIDFDEFSWK